MLALFHPTPLLTQTWSYETFLILLTGGWFANIEMYILDKS